jgi:hypothetical protein
VAIILQNASISGSQTRDYTGGLGLHLAATISYE